MKIAIGIDPGTSGAIASYDGETCHARTFEVDGIAFTIHAMIRDCCAHDPHLMVYLERVNAFPGQGVSSSFKFGRAFGEAIGALDALEVPYKFISPHTWQKTIMGLPRKKDGATAHKRALKQEAQRRFPNAKPTLKTCDALLIAEYGYRDIASIAP